MSIKTQCPDTDIVTYLEIARLVLMGEVYGFDLIPRVADRLDLSDQEVERLTKQLQELLGS